MATKSNKPRPITALDLWQFERLGAPSLSSCHRCSTVKRAFLRALVLAVAWVFMCQRLRASWKSRCVFTTGHSAAVML